MGAINYSRGGRVMQHSRQKCWDECLGGLRGGVGGLRGGVGGLCGGVGGLCGGPGEAGRGARRHRGRFSREARAHSPPSRPPLRWGIPGARGAGCLFPGRPERLAGHSWRARSGHCPRRGFSCHIPVGEDKEAARRRRGGEGGREYSAGPASCTKRTVVERAFASYQAMEGTGHPPRTNPPSSTQRASSSAQSSPGALMRRALAAVSSRCSPDGDRRGRRAVLLEWTGGGRQGRSGVPHSGVVVWRSALLLGMDAVAVQSDSGACVRGCGGCVCGSLAVLRAASCAVLRDPRAVAPLRHLVRGRVA